MHLLSETCSFQISHVIFQSSMQFVWTEYCMLTKHIIFPFSSLNDFGELYHFGEYYIQYLFILIYNYTVMFIVMRSVVTPCVFMYYF